MYIYPSDYVCPKCGHEMEYGPDGPKTLLVDPETDTPFCPKCLLHWIELNVPRMKLKEYPTYNCYTCRDTGLMESTVSRGKIKQRKKVPCTNCEKGKKNEQRTV